MNYIKEEIKDGVNLHLIINDNFKTDFTVVFLSLPLEKETVAKNALIPAILKSGCNKYKNYKKIVEELEMMYGAEFACGIDKDGDNIVLKFFIEINESRINNLKTIDEYFDFMKIAPDDRDKLLKDYSHGMKNKMQMLVNIIANPNILLLDEPLTSFDVVVAEEMKQMLKEIKKNHIIIFSTHIMELALDLCDEIVILNKGVLEEVDKNNLDNKQFKEKIIASLKEE